MHTSGIITSTYIEITQDKFNEIKWNNKSRGRQWELKQIHFWLEIRQLKAIANVKIKAGNRVGFGRVDLSQTHARRPYRAQHRPMTRPMGLKSDPCPYPSGSQTRSGTHRACPIWPGRVPSENQTFVFIYYFIITFVNCQSHLFLELLSFWMYRVNCALVQKSLNFGCNPPALFIGFLV
jgi:hypothetical protein